MKRLRITVNGVSYEVDVEVLEEDGVEPQPAAPPPMARSAAASPPPQRSAPAAAAPSPAAAGANTLTSPLAGIVTEIKVKPGDTVKVNDTLVVIEAMKMNSNVSSPVAGTIRSISVKVGDSVRQGVPLLEFN